MNLSSPRAASRPRFVEPLEPRQLLSVSPLGEVATISETAQMRGLLYYASDGLWRTDGTEKGTGRIHDRPVSNLTPIGKKLYFTEHHDLLGTRNLWKTDGTPKGTKSVTTAAIGDPVAFKGKLYFMAGDTANGFELWSSKGTRKGTKLLKNINPGAASSSPADLTVAGENLFFTAVTPKHGRKLWVTDGTKKGTRRAADINPGVSGSDIRVGGVLGDHLLFSADTPAHGRELWASDGTKKGTRMLGDLDPGTADSTFSDLTIFAGDAYVIANGDLWKADVAANRLDRLSSLRTGKVGSGVRALEGVDDELLFMTADALWSTRGDEASTKRVADIDLHAAGGDGDTAVADGRLYFISRTGTFEWRLTVTDGTADGTKHLAEFQGNETNRPGRLFAVGEKIVFSAHDAMRGREPWISDGTVAGTAILQDVNLGATSSTPGFIADYQGALLFTADDGVNGRQLFKQREPTLDFAGNTFAAARELGAYAAGEAFLDYIGSADSADHYAFTLKKKKKVKIRLEGLESRATLELFRDKNGNGRPDARETIALSDRGGKKDERITKKIAKGKYFLSVRNEGAGGTDYSLKFL